MKNLETSDWLVLNNIIYKIYTTEDIMIMRNNLLELTVVETAEERSESWGLVVRLARPKGACR